MKYICLIICLVLTLYHEYPGLCLDREEEIVEIKGIVGEFEILPNSSELSHKECMLKAREDAIKKAIGKVASTTVKVWTSVEASSTGDNFGEVAIISTEGEYADMKIRKEWMEEIEGSKVVVYKCLADIKVKKGMAPDPNFLASVHDIQDTYSDGDIMRFSLVPTKDCWMNIFLFEEDGSGYLIYPNRLDKSVMLKENTKISFPQKMIGLADIAAPKIFVRDSKWIISNSSIFLFISRVVECYISSIQTEFWKASDTSMLHVASQKDLSFSMSAMEPTIQDWLHPVRVLHAPHPMSAFSAQ